MKTLMKFGAVAAVALACGAASADYLYAMVKDAYYYYNSESADFDYLTVKGDGNELDSYGVGESGILSFGPMILSDPNDSNSSYGAPNNAGFYVYDPTGSYQTFLFEMFNDGSPERVAWQEFTRDTLLTQGNIYDSTSDLSGDNPLVISRVVPEPTSALLSLFGLAALALRRRKMA